MDINGHTPLCEDYISFETAKLLKEKGFNESIETLIGPEGIVYHLDENSISRQKHSTISNYEINIYSENVSCPTTQMALKWLREVHKYLIVVENKNGNYLYLIKDLKANTDLGISNNEYIHYEDACEEAIKHCLTKLIK